MKQLWHAIATTIVTALMVAMVVGAGLATLTVLLAVGQ